MRSTATLLALLVLSTCTVPAARSTRPRSTRADASPIVRVALLVNAPTVTVTASGTWRLADSDGASTLARPARGEAWTITRDAAGLRGARGDGASLPARPAPFVASAEDPGALIVVDGRRYRGEIAILIDQSGITVVNRLPLESYLRGVVPLEIGRRAPEERAAVEAQAVAARSFTYSRLRATASSRGYHLRASALDQVYGGADAERPQADSAVLATRGLVLTYGGRPVSAPYFSSCGGRTAAASEVWRSPDEPYLRSVSDAIPGTTRAYCDDSPTATWTRSFSRPELARLLDRYLSAYVTLPAAGTGSVLGVTLDGLTPSGRVRALSVSTSTGRYVLRGNDMRFVLRGAGGEILPSTYFSLDAAPDGEGRLTRLVLRGRGNGHGVGMCQWGAIGRARAGFDFRAILRAYYPGTSVDVLQ